MDDECVEELGRPITSFKVTELRDELNRRALTKTGNKKELIERLRQAIQKQSSSQTTESQEITPTEDHTETQDLCQKSKESSTGDVIVESKIPVEKTQEIVSVQVDTNPPLSSDDQPESTAEENEIEKHSLVEESEKKTLEDIESKAQVCSDDTQVALTKKDDTESQTLTSDVTEPSEVKHNQEVKGEKPQEPIETRINYNDPQAPIEEEIRDEGEDSNSLSQEPDVAAENSTRSPITNQEPKQLTLDQNENKVSNQDLQQQTSTEAHAETQFSNQASFSLKRGSLEHRAPSSNKEKRRKWSAKTPESNQSLESSQSTFMSGGISSQKLQELIEVSNIAPKSTPEDNSVETEKIQESVETPDGIPEEGEINTSGESISQESNVKEKTVTETEEIVDEEEPQLEKESKEVSNTEPEVEPTNILLVQNLVRPFTIMQLKEVLTKHGPIVEEKFWTDKVKSKCCVVFETIEVAQLTKESLHGQQWPSSNPKTLKISYIDDQALLKYQKSDIAKTPEVTNSNSKTNEKVGTSEQNVNKSISNRLGEKVDGGQDLTSGDTVKKRLGERVSDDATVKSNRVGENSKPQELDDLFKKTKSVPHLFWLPLTESQAESRQKERVQREKRSQESAQKSRRSPPPKRRSPPRHRSPHRRPSSNRHTIPERRRSRSVSRSRTPPSRYRISPPPKRRLPPIDRNSPPPPRRRPSNQPRWSPPPVHQRPSPGIVRRSPGLVRREAPIRRSPGPNRRSPGLIRRSPGPIRRSPAMIRRSPAPIRGSSPSDRSPPRKRSPMRRRSPARNTSIGHQIGYSDQHRRPQRLDRL